MPNQNLPSILIIDDELPIRKLLEITLESNGYQIQLAANAKEGIIMAANRPPDLIILDIGLPDKSGHDVLKELRIWYQKAIIILSVINNESDIVMALDNGANDYLTKPFRSAELLARIRSSMRSNYNTESNIKWVFNDLEIDINSRTVKKKNQDIKLTATEFNLLVLFAQHEGKVLTHQFILKQIWGVGAQSEMQYLRVFIGTLRKKIEDNPHAPQHIITENGIGYRFLS